MATNDGESDPLQLSDYILFLGGLLILFCSVSLFGPYLGLTSGAGISSTVASSFLTFLGIFLIWVGVARREWLNGANESYLDTLEGFSVAAFLIWLSILSFAIIIDRTPTSLGAAPLGSPEGLFVVPRSEYFSLGSISVIVHFMMISIIIVLIGLAFSQILNKSYFESALSEQRGFIDKYHYVLRGVSTLLFVLIVSVSLLLVDLNLPGGFEIEGRAPLSTPLTGILVIFVVWTLLLLPIPVFALPLLPGWVDADDSSKETRNEALEHYIDANWRRARVLVSLVLTGAIGTTLPFIFSRTSPYLLFVVAIVGLIALGPLGAVWFLIRRIREAEKKLRPM